MDKAYYDASVQSQLELEFAQLHYKQIELTGSSTKSSDDAIRCAIEKASKTLRNLHWFQVIETRGHIEDNKVSHWQVTLKGGLRIDD